MTSTEKIPNRCCPNRCWWCGSAADYQAYHDEQWGVPVTDDRSLFEKLSLEVFQCGLSWLTILRRREVLRACFYQFDIKRVADMTSRDVGDLLDNEAMIRHRGKIEAVISNAKVTLDLQSTQRSLAELIWSFEPAEHCSPNTKEELASSSPESTAMSRCLKKLGFRFVGPTTCYSLMQAMGIVNDHLTTCDWHPKIEELRANVRRPTKG